MTQTKIYPATQTQAQIIIGKVDAIDAKIVTPNYQVKTVMPSNVQQTVQADTGYTALSGVVVNPIAALMPQTVEDYILRNNTGMDFSLDLNGAVPNYACYDQRYLKNVYGLITSIGDFAFYNCTSLQSINTQDAISIGVSAFTNCTALQNLDIRNVQTISNNARPFAGSSIKSIDARSAISLNNGMSGCPNLKFVDIRNANSLSLYCFSDDRLIKLIDFTARTTPPTIADSAFWNTNNDFWCVFSDSTVKAAVQSATNWSNYSNHIKTIAEVEAEVGMTYDEYYYQCFGHARNEVAQ